MSRWTVLSKCPVICLQVCIARLKERPQNKYTPFKGDVFTKAGIVVADIHFLSLPCQTPGPLVHPCPTPRSSLPRLRPLLFLSFFLCPISPHTHYVHTHYLSIHLYIYLYIRPQFHTISFELPCQWNSIICFFVLIQIRGSNYSATKCEDTWPASEYLLVRRPSCFNKNKYR